MPSHLEADTRLSATFWGTPSGLACLDKMYWADEQIVCTVREKMLAGKVLDPTDFTD